MDTLTLRVNIHRLSLLAIVAGTCFLLYGCGEQQANTNPGNRPNVIFILVDTLRADRLGCYGRSGNLSPWMDELAREGILCQRAIATAPWTLPSVASYFSGLFPSVHKVTNYTEAMEEIGSPGGTVRYFGDQFTTFPELLQNNGYLTAGFSANPFISETLGFAQGFDHFDSSFAANETPGNIVNEAALNWLKMRDRSKPFFLYLHYMDIHDPYRADDRFVDPLVDAVSRQPQKSSLSQHELVKHGHFFAKSALAYQNNPKHISLFTYAEYWRARYDAGVPQINEYLNQLRARLIQMKLWDDTYVIITADHGESLGEHGAWAHGLSAHQDQLHVPLILRWPGHIPADRRITPTVRLFDVLPTLLEQLNIPLPEKIQARSFADLISGPNSGSTQRPPAFAEAVKQRPNEKALVLDNWKLLAYLNRDHFALYDLDRDPTEKQDVAADFPDVVDKLKKLLFAQISENETLGAGIEVQEKGITAEERRRLIELGYLDEDIPSSEFQPADPQPHSQPATNPTSPPPPHP